MRAARVVLGQLVGHVLGDVERGAEREPHVVDRRQPRVGLLQRQLHRAAVGRDPGDAVRIARLEEEVAALRRDVGEVKDQLERFRRQFE